MGLIILSPASSSQAAINSPAALPLQQGNELGNNKSHKGPGGQRLLSLFLAHPVRAPMGMLQDAADRGSLPSLPTGSTQTGRDLLHPSSPQCPRQQEQEPKSRNNILLRTPVCRFPGGTPSSQTVNSIEEGHPSFRLVFFVTQFTGQSLE